MTDSLTVFGTDFTGVTGIKAKGTGNGTLTYIRPQGTKSISTNGTGIDVTEYAAVDVSVSGGGSPSLQSKSATPTESAQTIEPDSGYDGLSSVTVGAISSSYVGSGIDRNDSTDLTASGDTVSVPAGYYATAATKSVASGSLGSPSWSNEKTSTNYKSIGTFSNFSEGYISSVDSVTRIYTLQEETVTPSTSQQVVSPTSNNHFLNKVTVAAMPSGTEGTPTASKGTVSNHAVSVTPSVTNSAGYIAGGTKTGTAVSVSASELVSGTYTVDSSGTKDVTNYASASVPAGTATAPSSISGSSATVSTGTNTLTLSKTVSVTPSISTAGYISSGTAGNSSVSLTASVTTQGAQTIHPSTSDQTIAASRYLTGAQTIKAVTTTNLTAANIKSGVTVKVGDSTDDDCVASVAGSLEFATYYVSSSSPSGGNNGDIWLDTDGGGSGGGGGDTLVKIGDVATKTSQVMYLYGGVWKDHNGDWTTSPQCSGQYNTSGIRTFELYAPSGASYVDVCAFSTADVPSSLNSRWTFSGNAAAQGASSTKYLIRISGDCTLDYYD